MNTRNLGAAGGLALVVLAAGVGFKTFVGGPLLPTPIPAGAVEVAARIDAPERDAAVILPKMAEVLPGTARQAPGLVEPEREVAGDTGGCPLSVTALEADGAMVILSVFAECAADAAITVAHAGVEFAAHLDARGRYTGVIPALTATARFEVTGPEGQTGAASVKVAGVETFSRMAVTWQGPGALGLFGGEAGEAMRFGDAGARAVIYSEPSRGGEVALEAEVTAQSCGLDMRGELHRRDGRGVMVARDFMIAMPDCGAVGDIVVLNSFAPETKIALNQ